MSRLVSNLKFVLFLVVGREPFVFFAPKSPVFEHKDSLRFQRRVFFPRISDQVMVSLQQAQDLCRGDHDDAEHQVQLDLEVTAHAHMLAAVIVFEHRVDAFGGAAFVVAPFCRWVQVARRLAVARVRVDDRHVGEAAREIMDFPGVVGGVQSLRALLRLRPWLRVRGGGGWLYPSSVAS